MAVSPSGVIELTVTVSLAAEERETPSPSAVSGESTVPVFGRNGRTQKREKREIGVHAIRGGTVPGEHEVGFYGPSEVVTLSHSAQDRSIFARGALKAARFIAKQAPGEYSMDDLAKDMVK